MACIPKILVVLRMNDEGSRKKLAGIFDYIRESSPWNVILTEPDSLASETGKSVDGIITDEWPFDIKEYPSTPKVILHFTDTRLPFASYITCDNASVVKAAIDFLTSRGFSSFAYIHDKRHSATSCERARFANCPTWPNQCSDDLVTWMKALPQRTAVLTADDTVAHDAMLKCKAAGISIPRDLAFIGIDNDDLLCEACPTPLTSVEPDFRKGGYMAAKQLSLLMAGETQFGGTLFYGVRRIVERESSQFLIRKTDPRIEKAFVFIRTHATERIGVNDVASAVGYSRRTIECIFRKKLKRSVGCILRKARIDVIMKKLTETDLTISQICAESGFLSESHAKRSFKAQTGMTMNAFRAKNVGLNKHA